MKSGIRRIAAILAASTLVLAACSQEKSSQNSAGGEGIDAGATQQEYEAAFAEMDPVKIVAQTSGPKGSFAGGKEEAYMAAIEDWSGGKISFDISYAKAIAEVGEEDDAIADGRLDFGMTTPAVDPDKFPVFDLFQGTSVLGADGMPIAGPLQGMAFMQEVGFGVPELSKEYDDAGMHLLLPSTMLVPQVVFCTKKRSAASDMNGAIVSANSTAIADHLKAIGASPTSLAWTELYEGLQRGTLDCAGSSLAIAATTGLADPAPFAMYSPTSSIGNSTGGLALSKRVWDELPLVAQQLFHDRLDVYLETWVRGILNASSDTIAALQANGGDALPFDDTVAAKLKKKNEATIDGWHDTKLVADPDAMIDLARSSAKAWTDRVTGELGFDEQVSYADFPAWWKANGDAMDLKPYVAAVEKDILSKHRPS